jgi:hypothetical protein
LVASGVSGILDDSTQDAKDKEIAAMGPTVFAIFSAAKLCIARLACYVAQADLLAGKEFSGTGDAVSGQSSMLRVFKSTTCVFRPWPRLIVWPSLT